MQSAPFTITRLPTAGQYFIQDTDPTSSATVKEGDIWINTEAGGVNVYRDGKWMAIQLSGVALMDACITNRLIAADISGSKIKTGRIQSKDGSFWLDLDTGLCYLGSIKLSGQVEGNIIAMSNNGLMRVRLSGINPDADTSAMLILEARDNQNSDKWDRTGTIWIGYSGHSSCIAMQRYYLGSSYVKERPTLAENRSAADGIMLRPHSQDYLRAAYVTYHGIRLAKRDVAYDNENDRQYFFENIPAVNVAQGSLMSGTSVKAIGAATMTYCMNDVARIDFTVKVTTAGTAGNETDEYGLSTDLIRSLNTDIPELSPQTGGNAVIYTSSGTVSSLNGCGCYLRPNSSGWDLAALDENGDASRIGEESLIEGMRITGTCYAKYSIGDD